MRLYLNEKEYIETNEPLDLSIGLQAGEGNLRAWYVNPPTFEPVRANGFIGSVKEGGGVNFRDVFFNPHGHGTHTECHGHITPEVISVNQKLRSYFFKARVVSVQPEILENGDELITKNLFAEKIDDSPFEALIIRTLQNSFDKTSKNYSDTNPPYLDLSVMEIIEKHDIQHLLVDMPSVDRESDEGKLAFHHAFWNVPENPNDKTITELIYVKDEIIDGLYILEMQMAPFENDASPSRPVLYKIQGREKFRRI
jgi:kynurenine formamidase